MDDEQIARFCRSLPGAREDLKWGCNRVFSVAGNKMFALIDTRGSTLGFKVDADLFLGHIDRPGIRPAPYLARAHWISLDISKLPVSVSELQSLLQRSHQLVVARLPKRQRPALLLDAER